MFPKIRWLGTERIPKFQSAMSLTASHSKFYRALFVEIEALVSRWNGLQSESASYFATLATVSDRIRLLQEHSNDLGVLSTFENLSEQMVRTQYAGLESVMGTLKTAYTILETIVANMEEINFRSQQYYESNSINSVDLLKTRPLVASVAQSIEWLQYISNSYRKELLEKKNILERVNYENGEGISFLYGQWAQPIHIDRSIIADYLSRGKGVE